MTKSISLLHVEVFGQGEAIVLIHGWGLNAGVWHQVAERLARDYRVYAVDLPGFGFSRQLTISEDLNDWVKLVVAAIPEPAVWLGWSLGGLVATQAALSFPQRVTKLITVASSPQFVAQGKWPGISPDVLATFEQQLEHDFAVTLDRFLAIQAMGSASARQDIKALHQVLKQRPLPDPQALKVGLKLLATVDLRADLSSLSQPLLRLYGRLDSLVNARAVKQIDLLVPSSQKFVFAKASHAPFISDLAHFIEQVSDFVCVSHENSSNDR
jgi:pimeloyl-[acyl-carrier protein] methyl ester esterase